MGWLTELDQTYVAGTYGRFPVELQDGRGSLLWDFDGNCYIDMGSGIAVTSFGVSDPEWVAAVTAQLGRLQHSSNLYYTEPCARLAEQLCLRTGMKKVFFSNSGAEANECAVKVARKYAAEHKGSEFFRIITLTNSFHGRTLTTLAATGQDKFHELFQPLTPGFLYAAPGDLAGLRALTEQYPTAAVLMEPVQGEGGVVPLSADFVQGVAALCKEKDILLMMDEVQTGNGRTGQLYGYMSFGVTPDVVTTAKGLGGGLPIGATLLGEKVQNVLGKGDHGSTFGGNPAACAGALNVLSRIDEALLAEVREKSDYVFRKLTGAPGVLGVSGMGLMIGIQTEKPVAEVLAACRAQGVLCLSAKDRLRLLPALNVPWPLLEKAVEVIKAACGNS